MQSNGNSEPIPLSLSIVIMAYNEVENIGFVLEEIDREVKRTGRRFEILVVDDGSTDGTGAWADHWAQEEEARRVIHHETNLGIGQVLSTGFHAAQNDLVTIFPADGQFPADIIGQFLPYMEEHDLVLGYVPNRVSPLMAKILSRCERLLLDVLFGRLPHFQGIYMFRRSLLDAFPLTSTGRGWIIQMELIIRTKKSGHRLISVPTTMRKRLSGHSKARNLRSVIANMKQVIQLYWRLTWSK